MKFPFQNVAMVACRYSVLLAIVMGKGANALAEEHGVYSDADCTELIYASRRFKAYVLDFELVDFDECVSSILGYSYKVICDPTTGETGHIWYSDESCVQEDISSTLAPTCSGPAYDYLSGNTYWLKTECTDDDPSTIVTNTFDVVGTAYTDDECTEPNGDTDIISSDLWGNIGSGDTCTAIDADQGFIEDITPGSTDNVCLPDGTLVLQTFAPSDDSCSGDVLAEVVLGLTYYQGFYSYCSAESYGLHYLPSGCIGNFSSTSWNGTETEIPELFSSPGSTAAGTVIAVGVGAIIAVITSGLFGGAVTTPAIGTGAINATLSNTITAPDAAYHDANGVTAKDARSSPQAAGLATTTVSRFSLGRKPSATLAILLTLQLQFLATLSLIEYVVAQNAWSADFFKSLRWVNLWWPATFAEDLIDDVPGECSFGGKLGEYWSKVFVGNLTLNLGILVSLFVLHVVLVSAVEAYWLSKSRDEGTENESFSIASIIRKCRDRSSSAWIYFPHVELAFLLYAFEGAVASFVAAITSAKCLSILIVAVICLALYPILMFLSVCRTVLVRVIPKILIVFNATSGERTDGNASGGDGDVKELVKAGLFSSADKGSWCISPTLDEDTQREAKRLLIGFAPLFMDYTQSGSFFAVIALAQSAVLACIGVLLDKDSASQLMANCVVFTSSFIALLVYQPYANKAINAISITTAASNAISTGLMTGSALWFEEPGGGPWQDRINVVVASLQLVTLFWLAVPVYVDTFRSYFVALAKKFCGEGSGSETRNGSSVCDCSMRLWLGTWCAAVFYNVFACVRDTSEGIKRPLVSIPTPDRENRSQAPVATPHLYPASSSGIASSTRAVIAPPTYNEMMGGSTAL